MTQKTKSKEKKLENVNTKKKIKVITRERTYPDSIPEVKDTVVSTICFSSW